MGEQLILQQLLKTNKKKLLSKRREKENQVMSSPSLQ